jgi:hypothetical protein
MGIVPQIVKFVGHITQIWLSFTNFKAKKAVFESPLVLKNRFSEVPC